MVIGIDSYSAMEFGFLGLDVVFMSAFLCCSAAFRRFDQLDSPGCPAG